MLLLGRLPVLKRRATADTWPTGGISLLCSSRRTFYYIQPLPILHRCVLDLDRDRRTSFPPTCLLCSASPPFFSHGPSRRTRVVRLGQAAHRSFGGRCGEREHQQNPKEDREWEGCTVQRDTGVEGVRTCTTLVRRLGRGMRIRNTCAVPNHWPREPKASDAAVLSTTLLPLLPAISRSDPVNSIERKNCVWH